MNTKKINRDTDAAFGIIPLEKKDGNWQVFIVQSITGNWGFPKGHADGDHETHKQSAERELREETGLFVSSYFQAESLSVIYDCRSYGKFVSKTVTLFLAEVHGNIHLCPIEIAHGMWIDLAEIQEKIVFKPMKPLLKRLEEIVLKL